jgi:hypothetical protein
MHLCCKAAVPPQDLEIMSAKMSKLSWEEGKQSVEEQGSSWVDSPLRKELIKRMPDSEKKRRRFIVLIDGVWVDKTLE